jgi:hypothetical protein
MSRPLGPFNWVLGRADDVEKAYILMGKRAELKAAKRSLGIMLLIFVATPSMAQSLDVSVIPTPYDLGQLTAQPQMTHKDTIIVPQLKDTIIVPQLVERFEPDGARMRQRGIIVGKEIAPNMKVGLGFADRKPRKSSLSPNHQPDGNSRRSGKASILLILKF